MTAINKTPNYHIQDIKTAKNIEIIDTTVCPYCLAAKEYHCTDKYGTLLRYPHTARVKIYLGV